MEKNFNTDNFEQLLREATDDFRMYPSKRVWHGIYNDLHPAKRWPSFAILLLLVTSIMYIGVTNPDKAGQAMAVASTDANQNPLAPIADDYDNTLSADSRPGVTVTPNRNSSDGKENVQPEADIQNSSNNLYVASIQDLTNVAKGTGNFKPAMSVAATAGTQSRLQPDEDGLQTNLSQQYPIDLAKKDITEGRKTFEQTTAFTTEPLTSGTTKVGHTLEQPLTTTISVSSPAATPTSTTSKVTGKSAATYTDESGWMEDYAFRNMKSRDKWKGRMAYQVYVTPSIGYRTLKKNADYSLPPANALVANPYAPTTTNYTLNHSSAINLEIGGGIIYSASKFLRLKAGVQLNYTNYSINAQELNHPTFTALMLTNTFTNTPVLSTRTTTLANTPGPTSKYLNNSTYQVSIPIGADVKIAGNDMLKIYLGATLQPTYILGGQSYLISSDMKNYVAEENFIQKYNLNGSVESFITYKTKSGVTLNAGPQFRYQLFSTYNKMYTYDEKLYNLGVRLGMTKNF